MQKKLNQYVFGVVADSRHSELEVHWAWQQLNKEMKH